MMSLCMCVHVSYISGVREKKMKWMRGNANKTSPQWCVCFLLVSVAFKVQKSVLAYKNGKSSKAFFMKSRGFFLITE